MALTVMPCLTPATQGTHGRTGLFNALSPSFTDQWVHVSWATLGRMERLPAPSDHPEADEGI